MARLLLFPPAVLIIFPTSIFGWPCSPNKKDDVLLGQFFISSIFDNRTVFNPPFAPIPLPPAGLLRLTALPALSLSGAIKHYQEICRHAEPLSTTKAGSTRQRGEAVSPPSCS